jgi:vancomycin resistance protein YoaR
VQSSHDSETVPGPRLGDVERVTGPPAGLPGEGQPAQGEPATPPRRGRRLAARALAAVAAVVALLALAVGGLALVHRGEALPGMVVADVEVGGRDPAEIRARLAPVVAERRDRPITLTTPGGSARLAPTDLGYGLDLHASVARALQAGRDGSVAQTAWSHVASLWTTRRASLAETVDRAALRARVEALADTTDRVPHAGGITVDPATLAVTRRPPVDGVTIRREDAVDRVVAVLTGPRGERIALPADVEDPGTTAEDVEAVAAEAEAAVSGPVLLTSAGQTLTLEPATYAGLLGSEPDGEDGLRLTLDTHRLTEVVTAAAAAQVDQAPRSARLAAPGPPPVFDDPDDAVWTPRPAAVPVTEPSAPGRAVDVPAATTAAAGAIRSGTRAGPLAVTVTEPPVTTEAAARVGAVIGTFTTYHAPGQPRVANIHRIADEIDGTVVPAGKQFSIDRITGRRTLAEGYVRAPQIVRGQLEDGVAGGISQFGTTMFNAAFFAGLPLDEFQPHSFYISRYPVGREATLAYGALDVKWTNDTGAPVLVDTSYTATSITVTLYGDNGGRRVEANVGARRPRANGGFTVGVTRTVSGPVSNERTITTSYNPAPE